VTLPPGVSLRGEGADAALVFATGSDGAQLTRDNELSALRLETSGPQLRAIHNDASQASFGTLTLRGLSVLGRVELLAKDALRSGHLTVDGLDIEAADACEALPRPYGFNVHVRQGAFTLYNQQTDSRSVITADLAGIAVGRPGAPAAGSGVFVSGTDGGGRVEGTRLHTGAVYSDGGIPAGSAGQITGGVFVVYASFREVVNHGPVTTYGVNDMVLDLWGAVAEWTARAPVTSHGPSGIGFVNFGQLRRLQVQAPIETFGLGARGFNIYDGTVEAAEFERIVTHADAAVGVQVSQPFGALIVHHGIETYGGAGQSLVKGELVQLAAVGLSVKPGARARAVRIDGGVTTHGKDVPAIEILGDVQELTIRGGIHHAG
jgi:hypothetical protein